ncbi:MAG: hypothetical protein R6U94_13665 [Nitriliruptoraceae bacterium]
MVTDHDRARLRLTRRVLLAGVVLGVVAAVTLGLWGASGAAGLAVWLVVTAAGSVLAAFVTAILAIVDEARRVHVARRRTVTGLVLFAAGFLLLLLSTAVAATI